MAMEPSGGSPGGAAASSAARKPGHRRLGKDHHQRARMTPLGRLVRVVLVALLIICAIFPFMLTLNLSVDFPTVVDDAPSSPRSAGAAAQQAAGGGIDGESLLMQRLMGEGGGAMPVPTPRECQPGQCLPRRYFSTTSQRSPTYYLEPDVDSTGRNGAFDGVPSRPWDEASIAPLDLKSETAADDVRRTMEGRYRELVRSDARWEGSGPRYLPPQFPQWDRSLHGRMASADSTVLGMPPECCPTNLNHKFLTKDHSESNVLSEEELRDCECRSPRNYPEGAGRPTATIITAFYEMSSKHPVRMYEKTAGQLLATADPMVIFCEPGTRWVKFFIDQRKHAPTVVVPLPHEELRLKKHFPQETFWKGQYDIDPEGMTHHKGVNTMLYVIWDEKLVLLHTAAMLNPFNTTQFVWADTGYFRNPAPHAYRQSVVRINVTERGVSDESALMFQMIPYKNTREKVVTGNQVLVGGNSVAGTYRGISNLYSAFYETFWTMASTGRFVGSDQKVMYRTCHTYPYACHVHHPRKDRQWFKMLGELLPGAEGGESIGEKLRLEDFVNEDNVPVPPRGIVDDAQSETVWRGVQRKSGGAR